MLHIGTRSFTPVPAQCGIHLELDMNGPPHSRQVWRIDAGFVPADEDEGPTPWGERELWRLHVAPIMGLELTDWREWEKISLGTESDHLYPLNASFENLCAHRSDPGKIRDAYVDECKVTQRDGYVFVMQMDGEVVLPDGVTAENGAVGDFRLLMEIPFASVKISVPVNSISPLAAGRAIAAREMGLEGGARSYVNPFDPERANGPLGRRFNKHSVWLETPWRDER